MKSKQNNLNLVVNPCKSQNDNESSWAIFPSWEELKITGKNIPNRCYSAATICNNKYILS